ncbi:aldo/keto reductase family oxidoreductase [Photobacterium sp. OFAV2-7]|uniref:aldo/keto reductase n=1 Tax=Photobacterium sp. OFAV2-7 TaxID=2917748 RepID=UPI001EF700D1|nr:aldo/keto reductase [Photobacterium sp. OFAV2-7]MCG7588122.1 aldo/keto reductase [Photobacterium sp. OFAV2-7]
MSLNSINKHLLNASQLAYGCMGLGGGWNTNPITSENIIQARLIIDVALEAGINVFDHADIYTFSKAEMVFGEILKQHPSLRESMYIQSKCGIRFEDESGPGRYDFSAEWVTQSVNGSLRRLHTEKLDVLLLHRPDPLVELDELASSLNALRKDGKFDYLGVSNMNHHQISFLQSALDMPIIANQIEMSLAKLDWLNEGVMVGTPGYQNNDYASGTLEYCRLNGIQLQAWGCLARGMFSESGLHSDHENVRVTTEYIMTLCEKYQVPSEVIVLSFLLRHPANIQPVIGTTNIERIKACATAPEITLTREEWYSLFVKARGHALP